MQGMRSIFETAEEYEKLKFEDARELYKKMISTNNEELKKLYMNKLVMGTLYVLKQHIVSNNLDMFECSKYDIDDIMSEYICKWQEELSKGILLNANSYSQILYGLSFSSRVCDNLVCDKEFEGLPLTKVELLNLLYKYIEKRKEKDKVDICEVFGKYLNHFWSEEMINIFEQIYQRLDLYDKNIPKTKLKSFLSLFVDSGIYERLTFSDSKQIRECMVINEKLKEKLQVDIIETMNSIFAPNILDENKYIYSYVSDSQIQMSYLFRTYISIRRKRNIKNLSKKEIGEKLYEVIVKDRKEKYYSYDKYVSLYREFTSEKYIDIYEKIYNLKIERLTLEKHLHGKISKIEDFSSIENNKENLIEYLYSTKEHNKLEKILKSDNGLMLDMYNMFRELYKKNIEYSNKNEKERVASIKKIIYSRFKKRETFGQLAQELGHLSPATIEIKFRRFSHILLRNMYERYYDFEQYLRGPESFQYMKK